MLIQTMSFNRERARERASERASKRESEWEGEGQGHAECKQREFRKGGGREGANKTHVQELSAEEQERQILAERKSKAAKACTQEL